VLILIVATLGGALACRGREPECRSLLGEPLYAPALSDEIRSQREEQLAAARDRLEQDPEDVDAMIWVGRRTAYLGHYREAISVYDGAIERYPEDPRPYRHRGHRYITLRRFDQAIDDLERAARLIADTQDEIEPDGLPNARNLPRSTLHSNIWYHLGLAYYLRGNFEQALRCYRECLKVSKNPDMLCATSHWLYMTLRRLSRDREAASLLEPIRESMDIIENRAYHELLLMYKGERTADELLARALDDEDALNLASAGYGVGNWHLLGGESGQAEDVFRRIVDGGQWPAFGHIAAEAELARSSSEQIQQ